METTRSTNLSKNTLPEYATMQQWFDELGIDHEFMSPEHPWYQWWVMTQRLIQNLQEEWRPYQKRFLVSCGQTLKSIALEQIAYIVSEGRYSQIVTHTKEKYLLDESLERLSRKLPPETFYRVNRQMIIAYPSIQRMIIWSKSRIKLELHPVPEKEVIVSIDNSAAFKKWLNR